MHILFFNHIAYKMMHANGGYNCDIQRSTVAPILIWCIPIENKDQKFLWTQEHKPYNPQMWYFGLRTIIDMNKEPTMKLK